MTLYEYEKGLSINDIEILKEDYIEREMYLECAGIQKGIDFIRFLVLVKILINKNNDNGNEFN